MKLSEVQSEFIEIFNSMETWQEKFQFIVDMGGNLPGYPEHLKNPDTKIMSCNSQTYFFAKELTGLVCINGWSNASIPSGLIAVLREIFDGCRIEELKETKIDFHIKTDLINNLTEQRKAGLLEMINKILLL